MNAGELVFSGVSLVALVIGVVQVLKGTGISGRVVQVTAIVLAFVVFAGNKAAEVYPQFKLWFDLIMTGLYGVSACGLYDAAKSLAAGGTAVSARQP